MLASYVWQCTMDNLLHQRQIFSLHTPTACTDRQTNYYRDAFHAPVEADSVHVRVRPPSSSSPPPSSYRTLVLDRVWWQDIESCQM